MAQTAIAEAFASKGIHRAEVEFMVAVSKYLNQGGTIARAHALIDEAERRGGGGRNDRASNGHCGRADASPPNDGGTGLRARADKAGPVLPVPPSPQARREEGHVELAAKASAAVPTPAPRPKHTEARRGAVSIAAVQPALARSLFDRQLPDGRTLRQVRWNECPALAQRYSRDARILLAIHNYAVPVDAGAKLDSIVSEAELKSIVSVVERINHV